MNRGGNPGARTAVFCSVTDQAVAAAGNIAVLIVAARLADAPEFAVFAMVYMAATVVQGLSAAYVGQALVLERGPAVPGACRSAVLFAFMTAILVGLPAACVLWTTANHTMHAFAALGVVLPFTVAQDTLRYCFSALRLPHLALTADVLRLGVALALLVLQPPGSSATALVLLWGIAAVPALAVGWGVLAARTRGAHATPGALLRSGYLGRRFVVEFGVGNAASQSAIVLLGLVSGPLTVGALRGAATLFGPLNVLCNSATAFGPPLLSRLGRARAQLRATVVLAAVLAAVVVGWASVLLALPTAVGRAILGDTWAGAATLLPATGSQYVAIVAGTSALLALRVLRPRETLRIQLIFSTTAVALLAAGYASGGITGAAWGLCAGSTCKAAALWLRVHAVGRAARSDQETDDDHDGQHRSDPARLHRGGI